MSDQIEIEVVYVLPCNQVLKRISIPYGTTAEQAVTLSGLANQFPEIDPKLSKLGIFGKRIKSATILRHRDRVEIYRSLVADPKEARRKRAAL